MVPGGNSTSCSGEEEAVASERRVALFNPHNSRWEGARLVPPGWLGSGSYAPAPLALCSGSQPVGVGSGGWGVGTAGEEPPHTLGSPAPGSAARGSARPQLGGLCRVRTLQPTAGPVNQVPAGVARSGASAKRQPLPWGLNRVQRRDLHWVILSFSPAKRFFLSNFQWPVSLPPSLRCRHTDTLQGSRQHPASAYAAPSFWDILYPFSHCYYLETRPPPPAPIPAMQGVPLQVSPLRKTTPSSPPPQPSFRLSHQLSV